MKGQYFKLYSSCIPVMGTAGAVIINLPKVSFTKIPQFLCEILLNYQNTDLPALEQLYDDKNNTIKQHFNFLCGESLGFFTDKPEQFPSLSLDWDTPEIIKHAVLQIQDSRKFDYKNIMGQLDELLCKNMEIWFTGNYTLQELDDFLSCTTGKVLRSVALILPYDSHITIKGYEALASRHKKIGEIYLHRAPESYKDATTRVYATTDDLTNFKKTFFNIPADEYIIFLEFFTEIQKHNAYYNRKICIDADGNVKNCLTHSRNFGNIGEETIETIINETNFKELWYACNDRILGIKDSEFRYLWLNTHELEKVDDYYYRMID